MNLTTMRKLASDALHWSQTSEFGNKITEELAEALLRALSALDRAVEQRDFYLKDARSEFDADLARKTDEKELDAVLKWEG